MRSHFAAKRLSRAFSLGVHNSTPASLPVTMVPLSVLQWVREDAKVHAAREAQLNDARFFEMKARIELLEKVSAQAVATALFERDVARGKVAARVEVSVQLGVAGGAGLSGEGR